MKAAIKQQFSGLGKSATLAINEKSEALEQEGKDIIRFGFGQSPFPVPDAVVNSLKENAHRKEYISVEGLPELREAVASYHSEQTDVDADASRVFIGPGSKELMFLLQFILDGDTIIPTPSWVSYPPQAHMINRPVHFIHSSAETGWLITADALDQFLTENQSDNTRLLILNYPNNPSGTTFSENNLKELAETARKHEILVLSDEIYGRLTHSGEHRSIAEFYPEGTIVSSGLSKWCGAGGWRLGHFLFPKGMEELMQSMASAASETFSCVSAPVQCAAVRAYQTDEPIIDYLFHARRILKTIGQTCSDRLNESGIQTIDPKGGFYLFPDFSNHKESLASRDVTDSASLCEMLLDETGVALLPGSEFFRDPAELTARLAYVTFDGGKAMELSTERGKDSFSMDDLSPVCDKIINGISRITNWVNT